MGRRAGGVGGSPDRRRRRAQNSLARATTSKFRRMRATGSNGPTPTGRPSGSPCMRDDRVPGRAFPDRAGSPQAVRGEWARLSPRTNLKSAETRFDFVTLTSVIESVASSRITVSAPTCDIALCTAVKLPKSLAANWRVSWVEPVPPVNVSIVSLPKGPW